jgi:nucleoside-diphosphate-sugar epimerase
MPTVFLTGGTGFVGGHVARVLVEQGWTVRLLARDPRRAQGPLLEGLKVEVVPGDLSDPSRVAASLSGVDAVVHLAGLVKARTLEQYREVNARGTERLLVTAAKVAPEAIFLLVSSQAAAGPQRDGRPVTAADPALPVSWYGISKVEAEAAVARIWKGPWVILRPGVVFGPGDPALFHYFRMAARGWLPVPSPRTRFQIIAAEQAALAIARAASRRDLAGVTAFLCDPDPVTIGHLVRLIGSLPERPPRVFDVPRAAVRLIGYGETLVETVTRRSRPFNADKAAELLAGDWVCDGSAIRQALALPAPGPLQPALRATWDWYRAAGWLPGATL